MNRTYCAHCGIRLHRSFAHAPYCIGRQPHGPCVVCVETPDE